MAFKKIIILLLLASCALSSSAQELITGVEFTTLFDNREYSPTGLDASRTDFSARLTPSIGLRWEERNTLMVAVDLMQDFGDESKFLTQAKPQIWYQYQVPKALAAAGIFPRTLLRGDYGEAFFDQSYTFYNNRMMGVMGQYRGDGGFVEMAIDWEGKQSPTNRERFRILSGGQYNGQYLYGGYALSLLHFAKTSAPVVGEGVVDNMLVNPYGGVRFSAFFDFDIRLGYMQSLQRDRRAENGWVMPKGGVLDISMSRWGLTLGNMLYVGEDMMPFYNFYGDALYANSLFYGTQKNIYNRTEVSYTKRFFHDTLGIKAGFYFHYNGEGLGLQQVLEVNVKLQKIFSKRKK